MPGALEPPVGPLLVPELPVEPVELPLVEPEPEAPVESVELPPIEPEPEVPVEPEVPLEPVVPGDVLPVEPVDEGLVVEDEEPVEPEVPEVSSVLRSQAPRVSTADNATVSRAADLRLLDAYISVPFIEWRRLTVSQSPI